MISDSLSYSSAYMDFYKSIIHLDKMQSLTWRCNLTTLAQIGAILYMNGFELNER